MSIDCVFFIVYSIFPWIGGLNMCGGGCVALDVVEITVCADLSLQQPGYINGIYWKLGSMRKQTVNGVRGGGWSHGRGCGG